ncbi:hypothetical protein EBZ80_09420 [bacterium]|nr:hypothetical protein [bacterium]
MKNQVIKLAMVMFAFSAPVALAQVAAQHQSCIKKCAETSDSCQIANNTDEGDAACVATENKCNENCLKAEKNLCRNNANLTYAKDVQAARVAFQTKSITLSFALKEAQRLNGRVGLMFPGQRKIRDDAIESAKTKHDKAIKDCK